MAANIVAAVDETAANTLLHAAEAAIGTKTKSDQGSLGPFGAGWTASASFTGGTVSLAAPDTVSIDNLKINYSLNLTLSIDLSFLDFCLPHACIGTPLGDVCTPPICWHFDPIAVPVPFPGSATFSGDFGIKVHLTAGDWFVDVVFQNVRKLDPGAAALLLTAILSAISAKLNTIPFIGPVLGTAMAVITAAFGVTEVAGLLEKIVNAFVSGLTFNVYKQPQVFQVLPASGPFDPAVNVTLAAVTADVQATDKNELVLSVGI